jgi:outer membrane protein assembly factor BamB
MSNLSPSAPVSSQPVEIPSTRSTRGRWKIGAALFSVACIAQAILWTLWWEDSTHFKMSVLFVWPAALFSLLIWWTFFSGWSSKVRYRSVAAGFALIVAFFLVFRPERFDGDMVPTRLSYRWTPRRDDKVRQYLSELPATKAQESTESEPLVAEDGDWPGFRGPGRLGVLHGVKLRTDWTTRPPKQIWRHPVGRGWSSFAVIGDYAFTQEQRKNERDEDSEAVVAYRLSDGEQIWAHMDSERFAAIEAQGGPGPRSTPQFNDGKLYTLGAAGLLNCLDARSGNKVWSTNILADAGTPGKPAPNLEWGMAGTPLILDQLVIVIPGGPNGNTVVAYDKTTGKKVWAGGDSKESHPATYASPSVATLQGEQVILAPLGTGLAAHSISDGRELWFFKWTNAPRVCGAMAVAIDDGSLLYGIGYGQGTVRLDVKNKNGEWSVSEAWKTNRFKPKFNDFVIRDGHAYGLDDGTLTCLDIANGKVKWKAGRYSYGQVLLLDNILLIVSEKGEVLQIPAEPTKPEVITSFQALDPEEITWNQPVLVRGKLLVRNAFEAACFELD